jgi:hypothetical protein
MKKSEDEQPDIEVEITNGKTVRINFSPLEWFIIMSGVSLIAVITGVTL